MKEYVVTYENNGTMKNRKFARYGNAKKFSIKMLNENNYPCVVLSTVDGMRVESEERFYK